MKPCIFVKHSWGGTSGDLEAKACADLPSHTQLFPLGVSTAFCPCSKGGGGGSRLQGDECWHLTYCCIRAQKSWQRLCLFNLEKKDVEFHLPAQSSVPLLLPPCFSLLTCQRNRGVTWGAACQDRTCCWPCLCLGFHSSTVHKVTAVSGYC